MTYSIASMMRGVNTCHVELSEPVNKTEHERGESLDDGAGRDHEHTYCNNPAHYFGG